MHINNGIERYNCSLKEFFNNMTPSIIVGFVEKLETETRNQINKVDDIQKGFLTNTKRNREEDLLPK